MRKRVPSFLMGVWLLFTVLSLSAFAFQFDAEQVQRYATQRYSTKGAKKVQEWLRLLDGVQGIPEQQLLKVINDFWNKNVLAGEDIDIWRVEDYWATPVESLGVGQGDCEDYVIGKYFSLIKAGVPVEKLRLIYVRAQVGGGSVAHMVLGYYPTPNAEPYLLDNLSGSIRLASQRPDLTPVFSFNSQGVYVGGQPPSSVERIGRWRGLLEKMRKEGFQP